MFQKQNEQKGRLTRWVPSRGRRRPHPGENGRRNRGLAHEK